MVQAQAVFDVVVLGEALCDLFTPETGVRIEDAPSLRPRTGGAPANVAVQLARLGTRVALVSAVGDDALGRRVCADLAREGVDVRAVRQDANRRTGITLVEVDAAGERTFTPWRERSADQGLTRADVPAWLARARALHTGTVTLRSPSARAATRAAVALARRHGLLVSLDVNLRYRMFPSKAAALTLGRAALAKADVVKATREEARDLVGGKDDDALANRLLARGPRLVLLTAGSEGALVATATARARVGAPQVRVVDATGAGDAFMGASLAALLQAGVGKDDLDALDASMLAELGALACRAGAAAVTALGATTAMVRASR